MQTKEILAKDDRVGVTICRLSIAEIIDLRHRLLRTGMPPETAQFPGDNDASTWHMGVFYSSSADTKASLVSCGSFMLNSYKEESAWQLRGMCTESGFQGQGFGGKLLECAEAAIVAKSKVSHFWCNARVPAIPFYQKHGWTIDSEEFDIPTAGPHRKLVKRHEASR
jgi:predicted GNAT family N-acyltransferase